MPGPDPTHPHELNMLLLPLFRKQKRGCLSPLNDSVMAVQKTCVALPNTSLRAAQMEHDKDMCAAKPSQPKKLSSFALQLQIQASSVGGREKSQGHMLACV